MGLTAKVELKFSSTLSKTVEIASSTQDLISALWTIVDLTDGTGDNKANELFHDRRTLSATTSESLDLYDFGGGAVDPLGQAITNLCVKLLYIKNRSTTAGYNLKIGGEGSGAAWNTFLDASDTAKLTLPPDGIFILTGPRAAGLTVADSTNHLLKIDNANAGSVDYDIIVIGATAQS